MVSLEQTQLGGEKYLCVDFESREEKNTPVVLRGGVSKEGQSRDDHTQQLQEFPAGQTLPLLRMSFSMHTGLESGAAMPCWVMIFISGAGHGLERGVVSSRRTEPRSCSPLKRGS